jgi:preprotein translocase subunit SecY
VLAFPATIFAYIQQQHPQGLLLDVVTFYERTFSAGKPAYILVEFLLIVFFTFFYSSIIPSMQPKEIADNLKKYGSSIPGIKPGRPTAEKLEEILTRTTFIGAFALAAITLIASSATSLTGISTLAGLGATSLLIMVGVALDTVNQIRVHLLARQYEGFLK